MNPGLYLVGTPIGHLGDMSARGIDLLREADLILAEDTRVTRRLLTRFEITTRCISCHSFNEAGRCSEIIDRIRNGATIALVTDSGMPAISDPGSRLVAACREAGLHVTAAPGPSAVTTALALSGFGGHGFVFAGFLPRKAGARRRILEQCAALPVPLIIYESPYRLMRLIDDLAEIAGPSRRLFIARELTKKFEETLCGTAAELREQIGERTIKGECTVVIESGNVTPSVAEPRTP